MALTRISTRARWGPAGLPVQHVRPARASSSYQPPSAPPNPHRAFYKDFGRPVAKVFLGALFTYQVLYWSWLKLESMEVKETKNDELRMLERQLKDATASRQPKV